MVSTKIRSRGLRATRRTTRCGWLPGSDPPGPMLPAVHRGLLGGTFDPPHVAHLVAAEAAYRQLGLDVVSFVPAGAPWQKAGDDIAAGEHRLAMTRLASVDVEYFDHDLRPVPKCKVIGRLYQLVEEDLCYIPEVPPEWLDAVEAEGALERRVSQ